ncbi:MAG TPA: ABC transporter permease subunit [Firmicutes bacterium]|nr:ABC transporter permease subunit [Bacillota bacterium]
MKCWRTLGKQCAVIALWIALWALLAAAVRQPLLLPDPAAVLARLFALAQQTAFWQIVLFSVGRIMLGILCAVALGAVMAVLSCRFSAVEALFAPLLTVVKATPVASFILLVLIWIGRGSVPAVIAALMVLPVVWTNVAAGVRGVDRELLEMADSYRLGAAVRLRRILIPSVMPYFLSAVRTGIGIGWKAGVAAEVLTVPVRSIGKMIYESKLYLETTDLFAWTAVVIVISLLLEKLLVAALERLGGRYGGEVRGND